MRKLILLLLFILIPCTSYAQSHWVYIKPNDKSGVTTKDDAELSKQGDIIQILPKTSQYVPTEKEKQSYVILEVSGLNDSDIANLTLEWKDNERTDQFGRPTWDTKAYRSKELNFTESNIKKTPGLKKKKFNRNQLLNVVENKTSAQLTRYRLKQIAYAHLIRPIKIVANIIVPSATAETISTINKTGEDYNTLQLWEDDKDGDLVTETRQETAEVYDDDGDLSCCLRFGGSTTNSTYYFKATVPEGERHDGTYGSGVKITKSSGSASTFQVDDDDAQIEWFVVDHNGSAGRCVWFKTDSDNTFIRQMICKSVEWTNFEITSTTADVQIENSLSINDEGDNSNGFGCYGSGGVMNAYNTVAYGEESGDLYRGYDETTGCTLTVRNSICDGAGNACMNNVSNQSYNICSDTTCDGTGSVDSGDVVFVNETANADSIDLHLDDSDTTAIDAGTDLSGNGFSIDIDAETRSGTWDIGADENVATASPRNRLMIISKAGKRHETR